MTSTIAFSQPWLSDQAIPAIERALRSGQVGGRGKFTKLVEAQLGALNGNSNVTLVTSGTSALLVALMSFGLRPGDRVLVPSFAYIALPQAVLLAGAEPIFCDVDSATGSLSADALREIDDSSIRGLIVIHYGGIAADMGQIIEIAQERKWFVLEDAAHGFMGEHSLGKLGTIGELGILSFDHQKNIQCGESGAVISRDPARASLVRTIASLGIIGGLDNEATEQFNWTEKGLKGYPPDYVAAMLTAQLESVDHIQAIRRRQWLTYLQSLGEWAASVAATLPIVSRYALLPSWHTFWISFASGIQAEGFIEWMGSSRIVCKRHYSSLARLSMGANFPSAPTPASDSLGKCLVRLPLGLHLTDSDLEHVVQTALKWSPRD